MIYTERILGEHIKEGDEVSTDGSNIYHVVTRVEEYDEEGQKLLTFEDGSQEVIDDKGRYRIRRVKAE